MAGFLAAMPMLIINMGGEMVYILEQRLRAQNIPSDKSHKVLQDVVKTMYNQKFIAELFKPQEMYSNASTRQIFDRLAHSSIMRLNESSMDKLYDLMTMGFKYQIVSCNYPEELLQVTLNHLDSLKAIVKSGPVFGLLEHAFHTTVERYQNMSQGDFSLLRQCLCLFFQGRRVKVSLFLQDGLQNLDGSMVVNTTGPVPPQTEMPGAVRYYKEGSLSKQSILDSDVQFDVVPSIASARLSLSDRTCQLGTNLYARDRSNVAVRAPSNGPSSTETVPLSSFVKSSQHERPGREREAAVHELNLLANLIGGSSTAKPESFKINLFPDTSAASVSGGRSFDVITIDASKQKDQNMRDMMNQFEADFNVTDSSSKGVEEDDDLLALMDQTRK
eukprot:GILK01001849.1.p1 GENE.GILK01001849.1~~GILK01001849.1.p1  ORF type:complete len:405 (-),score=65.54 GILK01001849.1:127-1290(-)